MESYPSDHQGSPFLLKYSEANPRLHVISFLHLSACLFLDILTKMPLAYLTKLMPSQCSEQKQFFNSVCVQLWACPHIRSLLSHVSRVRLCASPPGSAVPGILQARVLEWGSLKSPFSHLFSHPVECSRSQIFWVCLLASLWRHLACSFDLSPTSGS